MREIKFQFIYKGLPFSSTDSGFNWHKKVYSLDESVDYSLRTISDVHESCELIAKRQFTGLTDKNGMEVYEGDIIKDEYNSIAPVKWSDSLMTFTCDGDNLCDFESVNAKVIGNIYQNPELLDNKQ